MGAGLADGLGLASAMGLRRFGSRKSGGGYTPVHASDVVGFDFSRNVARVNGVYGPAASFLTTTRASTGYAQNRAGVYLPFAANAPRITDIGLLVEEARTNRVLNNTMVGAASGTPGTLPTGWQIGGIPAGLSYSVVSTGTENGISYIDLRFFGTPTVSGTPTLSVTGFSGASVPASTGQTWAFSVFCKLVSNPGGNAPGTNRLVFDETTGASYVTGLEYSVALPSSGGLSSNRVSASRVLSGGGTVAGLSTSYRFTASISVAYDFTLRIGWPQLELAAFASSPIPTSGSAATRAADGVYCATTLPAQYTMFAETVGPVPGTAGAAVAEMWNNNATDRARVVSQNLTQQTTAILAGGVVQTTTNQIGISNLTGRKVATRIKTNDLQISVNGGLGSPANPFTVPATATRLYCGSGIAGTSAFLNQPMKRLSILNATLSDAELQGLST